MDEQLLNAARLVRGYLPRLVDSRADKYDGDLRDLLVRASAGEDVDQAVGEVLKRSPILVTWVSSVTEDQDGLPPELQQVSERGLESLPGPPSVVKARIYECPIDRAYQWARPFVGIAVPYCPDHPDVLLKPRD